VERKIVVRALGLAVMVCALLGAVSAASADLITIDTVHVGDAGNAADSTSYGSVSYEYNIGKYEVTAGQYTAFLNAVAATDSYSLYNSNMWSDSQGCQIQRSGSSGSYTYTVAADYADRPVNYVSYWDACRFANWLNNGQGGAGTTEYGTYALNGVVDLSNTSITRNTTGATWAVTSEDEWYKAAYYKGGGTNAGYWLYPTGSDTAPGRDLADASDNNANYYGTPCPIQSPYYTTVGGEFQDSDSPYGTFDQGGNVWEWNEAILFGSYHVMRGGAFSFGGGDLQSGDRSGHDATYEVSNIGFRVSQVPEPASLGVLGIAVLGMFVGRRGARR
jgi:formylglycine-generating enzyme